jgi:PAS domain S-box-containing protein/putative nucleotidyltransferase with HDIG domain
MSSGVHGTTRARRSLATRIISASIALALLSTGIIVAARMIFNHFAERIEERVTHELSATNSLKRMLIEADLAERFADAAVFASRAVTRAAVEPGQSAATSPARRQALATAIMEMLDAYHYQSIAVVDGRMSMVAKAARSSIPREAMTAMAKAIKSGKPQLVDLFAVEGTTFAYGFAAPILAGGPSSAPTGAVYLEVDAERQLMPLVETWPTDSRTAESVLFRQAGNQILYLGRLRNLPGSVPQTVRRPLTDANLFAARALRGELGMVIRAFDYRGVPVIGIATRIGDTPWRLLSKIDAAEAEADVVDLGRSISALAALFILIAAALIHYIRKNQKYSAERAQAGLVREYQATIEATIEATNDAFVRVDAQGRILDCNSSLERLTGLTRAELLQQSLADLRHDHTPEALDSVHEDIRKAGSRRFETRWQRKDGRLIDIDTSVVFIEDRGPGHYLGFARDITESKDILRRLERMNLYREFLSHVTARIFGIREPNHILQVFCESAVEQGGFVLAWAGVADHSAGSVTVAASAGKATDYVHTLDITLDPALPTSQGPTGTTIRERRTMVVNDFLDDPHTVPWREQARQHGIRASAAVPLIVEGGAVGALMLYAGTKGYFDEAMTDLLEETARNVSLAWEAGKAQLARDAERDLRRDLAERYESLFRKSPLPSQIHDAKSGHLMAINEAHRVAFGYALEDIAGADAWFDRAYPDAALRQQLRDSWLTQIAAASRSGLTETSPEVVIRCRDGSTRIARGSMTVAGDDAIVGWVDLTEVRRREAELRDSETRFRGMVEQTIAGFYVVRDGRIVYANPQFTRMLGRQTAEIVGTDPVQWVEPEDRHKVIEGRTSLAGGTKSVQLASRWRRGDGSVVVLSTLAARGDWDGMTAYIVMVEDISERARADDTIRTYVHRLEQSVTGTLQAVARMVDLRDPYTAGHERRVGLIASAIAREMGWDEQRCRELELIGLVHDIGKISVPAEILSKPSHLSAVEFEMIKGHAQAGYEILKDVQFNMPVADIIRQHHERMDGSGYPQGLRGEAIAMEARILAVADVLESMASHRPYRPALGLPAAIDEIQKNRGTLFDESVVDAMTRLVNDKGFALPE